MTSFHIIQILKTRDSTSDDLYACIQLFLLRELHQLHQSHRNMSVTQSLMFRLAQH